MAQQEVGLGNCAIERDRSEHENAHSANLMKHGINCKLSTILPKIKLI